MSKPTETTDRDRVLAADEISTMWRALASADMRESTRRILRLCLITGQRVGEVAGMSTADIDLDRALWTIPASRTKNGREHTVPLTRMALNTINDQIREVRVLSARKHRDVPMFVFPAPGARASVGPASIAKAVKREERETTLRQGAAHQTFIMGIFPWTPHDLRRTAATNIEQLGVSPFIVGHILNHVSVTRATVTSRVYARYDYTAEKREALELWDAQLSSLLRSANVRQLSVLAGTGSAVGPLGLHSNIDQSASARREPRSGL